MSVRDVFERRQRWADIQRHLVIGGWDISSRRSLARPRSYQNEELILAVEELRRRRPDAQWFIPVRFDDCDIPDLDIGGGRTLASFQRADLFGAEVTEEYSRLVNVVRRILESQSPARPLLNLLYGYDQRVVAATIRAIRQGGALMLGHSSSEARNRVIDPLSLAETPDIDWDLDWGVLRNYAEQSLFEQRSDRDGPTDMQEALSLIENLYDPIWRIALSTWATENREIFGIDAVVELAVFDYAAALDLGSYAREFDRPDPLLETVFAAGRLPCPPSLIARSPELARLAMRLWRITSADSPMRSSLVMPESLNRLDDEPPQEVSAMSALRAQPRISENRSDIREEGARLEKSVMDVLERIFALDPEQHRMLRRQRPGLQYGTDIIFRARAINNNSTCLVECKNYTTPLSVKTVADKVLQAEASYRDEPLDHWILISPHQDPSNELDLYVQHWNSGSMFPFTIQIWSPETRVQDLFSVDSQVYRDLYGEAPPNRGLTLVLSSRNLRIDSGRLFGYPRGLRHTSPTRTHSWNARNLYGLINLGLRSKGLGSTRKAPAFLVRCKLRSSLHCLILKQHLTLLCCWQNLAKGRASLPSHCVRIFVTATYKSRGQADQYLSGFSCEDTETWIRPLISCVSSLNSLA